MAVYDFSAPFVAARIVLPDGDAFPLWTNVGGAETLRPTVPGTEDIQALAFVQEIQVRLDLSGIPQITAQLAPPFADGMKFLDSPLADGRMQNTIEVQLGYAGGTGGEGSVLSPPFSAALVAPEVTIDTEIQISLKGQGLGTSAEQQQGRRVGRGDEKIRDLIERIAAGPGGKRRSLTVNFDAVDEAGPNSDAWKALDRSATTFIQAGSSDWFALWRLADMTHCVMSVIGPEEGGKASVIRWLPRVENFSKPPVRRYRLYHYAGGQLQGDTLNTSSSNAAEAPLLSFSCNTEAIWNALTYSELDQDSMNNGVVLTDVNEDDVVEQQTPVTPESAQDQVNGAEGAQTVEGTEESPLEGNEGRQVATGAPDNPDVVTQATEDVANGASMTVQCDLEVLGDPTIVPGDNVALSGLGRRFDSRVYSVMTVTHSIGLGGYSTNLTVQSNLDPVSRGRSLTGRTNTTDVQAPSGYSATSRRTYVGKGI